MAAYRFFYFLGQSLESVIADISTLASAPYAADELVATERLRQAIALDYQEDCLFDGGKTAATGRAFAATADRSSLFDNSRIDDARLRIVAKGTVHRGVVPSD